MLLSVPSRIESQETVTYTRQIVITKGKVILGHLTKNVTLSRCLFILVPLSLEQFASGFSHRFLDILRHLYSPSYFCFFPLFFAFFTPLSLLPRPPPPTCLCSFFPLPLPPLSSISNMSHSSCHTAYYLPPPSPSLFPLSHFRFLC